MPETYFLEMQMMTPPADAEVIDLPTSVIWFDEFGIVHSIAKNVVQETIEEAKIGVDKFMEAVGHKKVCIVSDSTNSPAVNKELRDYGAEVLPQMVTAIAILSASSVGRMAANLFFTLKKPAYPVKFFNNEAEAVEWLKNYL